MSIASQIQRLKQAKNDLFNAITSKGGVLDSAESISVYASAIDAIEINAGESIDLDGVTVTSDKLLAGVVAVNADGKKITGAIPQVAATSDGKIITVPAGFIAEAQTFSVGAFLPDAVVTVNKNVVYITSGAVDAQTVTIPEAVINKSDTSVTVSTGYVSEEQFFEISKAADAVPDFGYINADGKVQIYDFTADVPVKSGEPFSSDIYTLPPPPYEGEVLPGEYLRFTAVEPSTVMLRGGGTEEFFMLYRKNELGYWSKVSFDAPIQLDAGEYIEFYGNYPGTTFLEDLFEEDAGEYDGTGCLIGFKTTGKLRASGYLNSVSEFKTAIEGSYRLLFSECPGLLSTPAIPQMTGKDYKGDTIAFPFEAMMYAPDLEEIHVEFTNWNGAADKKWYFNLPQTGTFYKPSELPETRGTVDNSGFGTYIPPFWNVVNIEEEA